MRGALLGLLVGACAARPDPAGGPTGLEETGHPGEGADTGAAAPTPAGPLPLCINEFMPANDAAWQDALGLTPDWIELHNPTDAAVALAGWTLSDDEADPGRGPLSGVLAPGGFLFLRADGGTGADQLPFRLSADGGQVALFAPDGRGQVVTHGAVTPDFSVARVTDCCVGDGCLGFSFRGTPGYGNTEPGPPGEPVLPAGSFWRVLAWPAVPPADWAAPGFDDAGWTLAQAPVGYGEDDLVTVIDAGAPDARVRTLWARTTLTLDATPDSATLRLRADDGARVVIGGVEVARVRMPAGDIGPDTLASEVLGGDAEAGWDAIEIGGGRLVAGENTIAVEVHQATPTSEDLVLDLAVSVRW